MPGANKPSVLDSAAAARIEQLLQQLAIARDLSARELQVAVHGARGLDTKATAAELGVSPKTVDEFWRRLYRKFNCRSRVELLSRLLACALAQLASPNVDVTDEDSVRDVPAMISQRH